MDSDLLDFVSGTINNNNYSSNISEPLKKKKKSNNVSITDLTSILTDKTGYSNLKKKMGHLQNSLLKAHQDGTRMQENVDPLTLASTLSVDLGTTKKIPILSDPLKPIEAKRLERQSALELATREANRWIPVIRGNRKMKHLHFSSTPKKDRDQGTFVQNCEQLVSSTVGGDGGALENEMNSLLNANQMTSMHKLLAQEESEIQESPHIIEERYKELAKRRSLLFFEEKKRHAQKKIKSKSFRRQLKKERIKEIEKSITPLSTLSIEEREEMRLKAGMDRIRERMTLRTRKADKWAHDRLSSGSVKERGSLRDGILEQLRDKTRLREEIMGAADDFTESEDEDVMNHIEEDHVEAEDDDSINNVINDEDDEDDDEDDDIGKIFKFQEEDDEVEDVAVAKRSFGTIVDSETLTENNSSVPSYTPTHSNDSTDSDIETEVTLSKNDEQQRLIREAFSSDNSIFHSKTWEERKEDIRMEEEKDRMKMENVDGVIDTTINTNLPGFGGKWSGSGIIDDNMIQKNESKGPKVLNSLRRGDGKGAHVIIHQRLPSLTKGRLLCPSAPHNYPGGPDRYEAEMSSKRLGKEWNRQKSHSERIQPRVTVSCGSIVDPIRFQKKKK